MSSQDMYDGVADIQGGRIDGTKRAPRRRKRRAKKRWLGAVAAVLAIAIVAAILLRPTDGFVIAQARYPEMDPYPNGDDYLTSDGRLDDSFFDDLAAWEENLLARQRDLGDTAPLQAFFARSAQTFLAGTEGENRVYSPLSVYMALSAQAQLTGGESREQILNLLGSDSMDALRQQASDVWNSNYRDDGAATSILASSLWLSEDVKFNQDTMDILADDLYASSFRGEMGSEEFDQALQNWLNEQTGGLLAEQAGNAKLDARTILALSTTVYFKARWFREFSKPSPQTFHAPGGDVEANFMHKLEDKGCFWGEKFSAVGESFAQGGAMWFLLPNEGVSPEELLADAEAMDFLFTANRGDWENWAYLLVHESIPQFDVASQFDLSEGLQALGVTDVFDPAKSDFTPMTTDTDVPITLSQASHAARVIIDEEGCTAAAFTLINDAAAGGPDDEVDFVLDRPFLFCITGDSGLPLFVGIVNHPA